MDGFTISTRDLQKYMSACVLTLIGTKGAVLVTLIVTSMAHKFKKPSPSAIMQSELFQTVSFNHPDPCFSALGVLISLASSAALFYYNGKDSLNVEFQVITPSISFPLSLIALSQIHAIEALLSSAFTVVVTLFPSGHMQSVTAFMAVSTFLQTLLSGSSFPICLAV